MMRSRPLPIVLAFMLGACATAAVEVVAAEPEPEPAPAPAPVEPGLPAAVNTTEGATALQSPTGTATITHLAIGKNAYLGKLEMKAGAAVPDHQDSTEEYIHVLSGTGSVTIDGQAFEVKAGTTIFMPANATVSFQNGEEPMIAIQVFAGPDPSAKYESWLDPSATVLQRPKPR